jgi:hypothetical protein
VIRVIRMSERERSEAFIRECCVKLGDDPKRVKLMDMVEYWRVQRADGRWRLVPRKAADDRRADVLLAALKEEGTESHLECCLPGRP